ncbi:FecR domain-containing protein [Methylobrevis pamukkalensis]|uniref:FecR protein n=1 Tax=Methylobrevis pamukkalensis TaxID=1439726 RepID=A0A1E3GYC3_9HYPH|nr:FecR domain-containing protein [Methylobrevis pamukkalensis]ODN69042.1 FecR protein [Methylobrevis pamukkalensis]
MTAAMEPSTGASWWARSALAVLPTAAGAFVEESRIGEVADAAGRAFAHLNATRRLAPRSEILLGDLVWTASASRASLGLDGGTTVHLGAKARLKIDRYVAESGGTLLLGDGALVFDRPEDLPKTRIDIRTTFGLIGIRGTRLFAGPSRGVFGVFVERGVARVLAGGVERRLEAGEGVDIAERFAPPSPVRNWGKARIDEAFASVLG